MKVRIPANDEKTRERSNWRPEKSLAAPSEKLFRFLRDLGPILDPFWHRFWNPGSNFWCSRLHESTIFTFGDFFHVTCFFLNFTKLSSRLHESSILASPGRVQRGAICEFLRITISQPRPGGMRVAIE